MELQPSERIIKTVYKPTIVYFFSIAASLILILGACFFMVPLFRLILFQVNWLGKAIFWFLIILGALFGLRTMSMALGNKLIITNQRLIIVFRHGLFNQTIFKINYDKIKNIGLSVRGLVSTIFHLGTLEFFIFDSSETLKFTHLTKANEIQELILHQQSLLEKTGITEANDYELIEMARKIRERLGQDVFRKIAEE